VVAALRASETTRLALLAPYPEPMTLAEKDFLEEVVTGLKIVSHRSLAMSTGLSIGDLEPSVAYRESRKVDTPEADAVFLSGTNWRTIDVIEEMETDLKKPVFTANQVTPIASGWATLCMLGVAPSPDSVRCSATYCPERMSSIRSTSSLISSRTFSTSLRAERVKTIPSLSERPLMSRCSSTDVSPELSWSCIP